MYIAASVSERELLFWTLKPCANPWRQEIYLPKSQLLSRKPLRWFTMFLRKQSRNSKRWEYLLAVDFKVRQTHLNGELGLLATTTKEAGYSSCLRTELYLLVVCAGSCRFLEESAHVGLHVPFPPT